MAKFCGNCGSKMDDNAKICGMCGTPFPIPQNVAPPPSGAINAPRNPTIENIGGVNNDSLFLYYLIETILFFLMGILSLTKTFQADVFGLTTKFTLIKLFDGVEGIPIVVCILIFVAAVLTAISLFTGIKKRHRMILQKIVSVLALLVIVATYLIEVNSDEAALYDFGLTFGGWLFVLFCVISFVLAILISRKSKSNQ